MPDAFPLTEHWLADHKSHYITEAQIRHILSINRPISGQARICQQCGWPASIADLCMLCCDMAEAIFPQRNLMLEHENWCQQQVRRRLGLL
jgi:hypothetical protein